MVLLPLLIIVGINITQLNISYKMSIVFFFLSGPPPPLPPLQPSGMDAPPSSITSTVPTIVTSGIRSSLPQASVPMFNSG